MAFEFKFPDVGEGITEGTIAEWIVKEGDTIKEDDVICKVETDKAVVDIPSPKAGTVLKINHKVGDTIKVGEVLITIGEKGEEAPKKEEKTEEKPKKKESTGVVGEIPETLEEDDEPQTETITSQTMEKHGAQQKGTVKVLPAVRRLARELDVELSGLSGSGKEGRITEDDVRAAAKGGGKKAKDIKKAEKTAAGESKKPSPKVQKKYDMYGYIEHKPLNQLRKTIAKNMTQQAFNVPHVTAMEEVDVTELWDIRKKENKKIDKKDPDAHLTFLPFIIKSVIEGLKDHPLLNSHLDEEHEEIIIKKYYNIGIAVDSGDGLLVPVVKNANDKNMLEIAKEIKDLAGKVKDRSIDIMDMKGGSFTITNYGSVGSTYGTPIIAPEQSAILGTGRIYDKVVLNDDGEPENRKVLPLSLSFDHRVTDGAEAARFLNKVKSSLEDPGELLVEMK